METIEELQQLISLYTLNFPAEQETLNPIIQFLKSSLPNELYDRKNFDGHITASAFLIDESRSSLLLLHHKKLNRWLQPGGHVDQTDGSLLKAAIRETVEETGLPVSALTTLNLFDANHLFDVDSHTIPANVNKNEPEHTHHDLRFLFQCSAKELQVNNAEAMDFKWQNLSSLLDDSTFDRVASKILNLEPGDRIDTIAAKGV